MWFYNWSPGWFWILPLLGLALMVVCPVMMLRGWHRGACCCFGAQHRNGPRPPNSLVRDE